jgi:DNA repair protein RecN (Recombination protein N)
MLEELRIQNLALIRGAELDFAPGLTVITGETGAGKTILVNAIGLISGARASSDMVGRQGDEAIVEAKFCSVSNGSILQLLEEAGIRPEEELIIKRIVQKDGRSKAYINGNMVTIQNLSKICSQLVTITGQFENQRLLKPETHLLILDEFLGLDTIKNELNKLIDDHDKLMEELIQMDITIKQTRDSMEIMSYALKEIESAALKHGEEEELKKEKERLKHATEIKSGLQDAIFALSFSQNSVLNSILTVIKSLTRLQGYDSRLLQFLSALESIKEELQDLAWEMKRFEEKIEADPKRHEECNERLHLISSLLKKYGRSIEEVLKYKEMILERQRRLEEMEAEIPEPDPVAYARMKYELENATKKSLWAKMWGPFSKSPDVSRAAKSGQPAMERLRPTIPPTVPVAAGGEGGVTDVTISTEVPASNTALDTLPDARQSAQQGGAPAASAKPEAAATQQEAQPAAKQGGKNSKNGKAARQPRQNSKEKK